MLVALIAVEKEIYIYVYILCIYYIYTHKSPFFPIYYIILCYIILHYIIYYIERN